VLYELATGRRPYNATSGPLLTDAILHERPAAPRSANPALSAGLERVILKALQKDPRDRQQSCRELATDLKQLGAPRSRSARPTLPTLATLRDAFGRPTRKRMAWGAAAIATVIAAVAVFSVLSSRPALSFVPRDWILVADVRNETGDPVFNRSLSTALRVGLEQSTVANVFSDARVETALKRMERTAAETADEKLGREICRREGLRGLVTASLSQAGSRYALAARLVDPNTGDAVRSYLESAGGRDDVLPALDRISSRIRRDLGESLGTIRQATRPLPQVTTRSLEALEAFAEGSHLWRKGKHDEAVRLYERAIALDPDFAKAHAALGSARISFVYNDAKGGRPHLEKALQLAGRTTDRERLDIEAHYHADLGHSEQASQLFSLYLARYPDDLRIQYNYANLLLENNRFEEAAARYREVLRLDPGDASCHINLATTLPYLGRVPEALVEYEKAFALEPTWIVRGNLNHEYGFALVQAGDHARARAVFDKALATPELKAKGLRSHALLDMFEGRYGSAKARLEESVIVNRAAKEALGEGRDHLFLSIALAAEGDRAASLRQVAISAERVAAGGSPAHWVSLVGVAFARLGDLARARGQLTALRAVVDATNPSDEGVLHRLEGEIALASGRPADALEKLRLADQELLHNPLTVDSLARGYSDRADATEAYRALARDLEPKCLGWEAQQPCVEAHYELARLLSSSGPTGAAEARQVLDRLLQLWANADPVPLVLAARELRRRLN
jgi:tetratricopeptide (TPR) repeat protein